MKLRISAAAAGCVALIAFGVWVMTGPTAQRSDSGNGDHKPAPVADRATASVSTSQPPMSNGATPRAPAQSPRAIVRQAIAEPYGQPVSTAATGTKAAPGVRPPPQAGGVSKSPPISPAEPEAAAATIDVDKVNLMVRDYRTRMGENPVGTNAEIMKAIMGGNKAKATLGPPEGQTLNEQGELVDRWGVPYFFHQLSADHMEIRSAGPDKNMWTADDVLAR